MPFEDFICYSILKIYQLQSCVSRLKNSKSICAKKMDDKGVEEVPEEEMEVEDEGDNIMEVTPGGKRKKPVVK